MSAIMPYILLIIGFVLLVKGADFFVDGASGIAKLLKVPTLIIGLTIVAMGTSAPEAAVSITAALQGSNGLSIGNAVGSNIFNLLVVCGICAAIKPLNVAQSIIEKELPYSILAAAAALFVCADVFLDKSGTNIITRSDGILLLLLFVVFLYVTIRSALKGRKDYVEEEGAKKVKPVIAILLAVGGLAGIIIGGQFVVDSATTIAQSFGVSQNLIGLTICAVGTSLPELVTSVAAAKKGDSDMAIGNVVGSNIFNLLFVLAASATVSPITLDTASIYDLLVLIVVSVIALLYVAKSKKLNRWQGISFLVMYAAYTAYILIRA